MSAARPTFICSQCGRKFGNTGLLRLHQGVIWKQGRCDICKCSTLVVPPAEFSGLSRAYFSHLVPDEAADPGSLVNASL